MTNHKVLVSSCLLGVKCAYDGKDRCSDSVRRIFLSYKCIPVCPEMLGGLDSPRERNEISGGSGEEVLDGKAKVVTPAGADNTAAFLKGAAISLKKALAEGVVAAVLKSLSPSCGRGRIYDGSFKGVTKEGSGVTAALLTRHDIRVFNENETNELEELLKSIN